MMHARWTLALLLAGCMLIGCGTDDGDDTDFEEGLPSDEMLTLDPEGGAGGGASLEGGLVGQPSCVANHVHTVGERVQTARKAVRTLMDKALAANATKTFKRGPINCKGWEFTEAGVDWQLRSCVLDKKAKRFAFALAGKAEGAAAADYKIVMGGTNKVLPRSKDNKRRGQGIAGFNFDQLNALTGAGPIGKMAFGYRAAGKYRQMIIGVKDFQGVNMQQTYSALYRFGRIIGTGGFFKFKFNADIFSVDGNGDPVGACNGTPDGLDEKGKIGIAWTADGKARMAGVICGGTIPNDGTDDCISFNQCWKANGQVSLEMMDADSTVKPDFTSVDCPTDAELPVPVTEAPADSEVDESALGTPSDEDNPSVEVDQPAEDPSLEGEE